MLSCDLQVGNYAHADHKVKFLRLESQEHSVRSSTDNKNNQRWKVLTEHLVTFQSNHMAISE